MFVGWAAAGDAAARPAAYRAQGEDGWASWLDHRLLAAAPSPAPPRPAPTTSAAGRSTARPLEAVRLMRGATAVGARGGRMGGPWCRARHGDARRCGRRAPSRWLAGLGGCSAGRSRAWRCPTSPRDDGYVAAPVVAPRARPSAAACGADARIGRRGAPGGQHAGRRRRLARTTAKCTVGPASRPPRGALVHRCGTRGVVVTAGDTGERARGGRRRHVGGRGGMTVEVVRQRAWPSTGATTPPDATPSARCRWCERRDN